LIHTEFVLYVFRYHKVLKKYAAENTAHPKIVISDNTQ